MKVHVHSLHLFIHNITKSGLIKTPGGHSNFSSPALGIFSEMFFWPWYLCFLPMFSSYSVYIEIINYSVANSFFKVRGQALIWSVPCREPPIQYHLWVVTGDSVVNCYLVCLSLNWHHTLSIAVVLLIVIFGKVRYRNLFSTSLTFLVSYHLQVF